jgi:thioesterase domain-containing protein/acyl carrier protein
VTLKQGADYHDDAFREWLNCRLPNYMIPSVIQVFDHFPLTSNGKIDLKELTRMIDHAGEVKKPHMPPRDITELKLVNIFKEILHLEDAGIEESFFNLGGHSLLAIRLFGAIENVFQLHLPLSTLFERGSVMGLAELIRKSGGVQPANSLVPIRTGSGKKQLYLVHPAGGNVLCYFELARELGGEYTVFGLQATGLYGKKVDTVSDMAGFYLGEINLPDCMDDVIFAGWSMGALIAFEMARQVGGKSAENPRLMIIDQLAPAEESGNGDTKTIDPVDRLVTFAGKVAHLTGRSQAISTTSLRGKTPEEQSDIFLTEFKLANLVPPDMDLNDFHGYLELMIHHNEITSACRPGNFDGKTLLIRAMDAMPPHDNQGEILVRTTDLGWSRWIRKEMEIANIPGNHVSIIAQPAVKQIAGALMNWMDTGK